ncbi:SDR family oxidoreductase, partial [Salmonella enterica]|uniref:SDR family oxidoreductase n=1 Tax=Salmonella enterica TaxID=28901 RepID=UPI0032B493EB
PTILINAAAYTAVDMAETEREAAFRVNAVGPEVLAKICQKYDTVLIHISTDYVFDGQCDDQKQYIETDLPNPINVYGLTKLQGEQAI